MTLVPGQVFVLTMEGDLEFVWRNVFNKWIVIQFGAEWSGVCASMNQAFVDLARSHVDVLFVHCDVDRLAKIAAKHGATRVPTYSFFWNGELETEFAGASERKLRDVLNDCIDLGPCPDPGEQVFDDRPLSARMGKKTKSTAVAKKKKSPVKKVRKGRVPEDAEMIDKILAQSAADAEAMKREAQEKQERLAKQAQVAAAHKEDMEIKERIRREAEEMAEREARQKVELEEMEEWEREQAEQKAAEEKAKLVEQRAAEEKARQEKKERERRLLDVAEKAAPMRASIRSPRDGQSGRGKLFAKAEEDKKSKAAEKGDDSGSDSGVSMNLNSLKTDGQLVVERNQRAESRSLPPPAWQKFQIDLGEEEEDAQNRGDPSGQRGSVFGLDRATKKSRERERREKAEAELLRAERQLKAVSKGRTSDPHLEGSLRDLESHLQVLTRTNVSARPARTWKQQGQSSLSADDNEEDKDD